MLIRFQGEMSAEDYTESIKVRDRWFLRLAPLIIPFMPVLIIRYGVWDGPMPTVLFALLYLGFTWWMVRFCSQKLRGNCAALFASYESLHGLYWYEIRDDMLIFRPGEPEERRQLWSECVQWKENDKVVVIFYSKKGHWFIPRRWFASDDDWQMFRELLIHDIGPVGRVRR